MTKFIVTDEGDYIVDRVSASTAEQALEQVSEAQRMCPDDLRVWTEREYRDQVLNRPWWELERDGLL